MSNFFEAWVNESEEHQKLVAQEQLILKVTEAIYLKMEEMGVNRVQLANRLGKTKANVSQLLSGNRNMTLRSLADISFALGLETPQFNFSSSSTVVIDNNKEWQSTGKIVDFNTSKKIRNILLPEKATGSEWGRTA